MYIIHCITLAICASTCIFKAVVHAAAMLLWLRLMRVTNNISNDLHCQISTYHFKFHNMGIFHCMQKYLVSIWRCWTICERGGITYFDISKFPKMWQFPQISGIIIALFLAMYDNMGKREEDPPTIFASAGRNGKENESLQGPTYWSQDFQKWSRNSQKKLAKWKSQT